MNKENVFICQGQLTHPQFCFLSSLFPIITLSIAQSEHCHMFWGFFSLIKEAKILTQQCLASEVDDKQDQDTNV